MISRILIFLIFSFFFSHSIYASTKQKILNKFDKIDNLNFDFKQTIDGKDERGNCTILYPKKIYCSYELNFNKILVSNGKSLVIKSDKNKQYYIYPLDITPLNIILDKDFLIKNIKNLKGQNIEDEYFTFKLEENGNIINIFFDKKNYNIIGWQTEDVYQNLSVTYIYNLKINTQIKKNLFKLPKMH